MVSLSHVESSVSCFDAFGVVQAKQSSFDAFEWVKQDKQPVTTATAQASTPATQRRAPGDETDEEVDPWWQAQASRWRSWQASGVQLKRQGAVAWWQEEKTSASYSAGIRCLCNNSAALHRDQESSSCCLQAQGWLSWSRTPCPNQCGRLIATGDAWALQRRLQHCPALSACPVGA